MAFVDVYLLETDDGGSPFEIKPTLVENKLGNNTMVHTVFVLLTTLSELSCFHQCCAAIQDINQYYYELALVVTCKASSEISVMLICDVCV